MRIIPGLSTALRLLVVSGSLLVTGLLFARFVGSTATTKRPYTADKVNLALRRTAHHLLRAAGDSTSRIPAVEQPDSQTFRVQLSRTFDYAQLPALLQESFRLHQVTGAYDVAVLDCVQGKLQLGYNISDFMADKSVPCIGRSLDAGCYVLQVTFGATTPTLPTVSLWAVLAIGSLLGGLAFVAWRRNERPAGLIASGSFPLPNPSLLYFGRSSLDVANQLLIADTSQHNLTYREAKLLKLLVSHPNQVLERDLILKLVWEDEGVTVGRSVDVFISRLRKLLHSDPSVRIAAVHGVGYRLEIQEIIQSA